jgi:cyclic beta-1,2-glucan synthetase
MSFGFLYDRSSGLFSIGYQVAERMQDSGRYDLLASEARLASLVAIAKGDVGRSHWRRLGRRLTGGSRHPVLASWSGSMFEYLMPGLVMDEPQHSLLEQTNRRVVQLQIEYGERHQLPWGISESAYNVRDREFTYQYSGFGLPSLGLKRGLSADYVVAPYACAMAAMYRPIEALQNFRALARAGARGQFGFREALDFTPARIPAGKRVAVVRAYMAHHQGMSLVALDNVLHDNIMHARFHAEPCITAADLLLQERRIRFAEAPALVEADVPQTHQVEEPPEVTRIIEGYGAPTPVAHLLSNRTYAVMLTDSGAGYSSSSAGAVTRWRQDATRDCWGSFIYLYDTEYRRLWSAGFQPTAAIPDEYRVHFHEECVIFERRDGLLRTTTSVVVAPDDDAELRQVVLRNDSNRVRHVELTSYAEIVLAPQAADIAHPGFSNLFVQTEFAVDTGALLATRRPRSGHESRQWAIHVIAGTGARPDLQYETDRLRFLGRGRSNRMPQVIDEERPLSNTVGNVLDPIFSLRTRVAVPPRGSATVTFATCVAGSRAQALALIDKYRTPGLFEHVVASAWTFARAELYYLQSSLGEAMLFQTLASHLLVATRQLRAGSPVSAADTPDVSGLWRYAISGDRPILLIRCHSPEELPFIEQCLRAQEYLRIKRAAIDVVILNQRRHSYVQDLQHAIEHLARTFSSRAADGENRGGIHALSLEQVDDAERRLLESLARVVLDPAQGSLLELLSRPVVTRRLGPPELPARGADPQLHMPPVMPRPRQLSFHNGWGGFDQARHEYFIGLPPLGNTPAPWSNVLANEQFGTLVTERGAMCTWSLNSRENQLTAWSNDPVSDPSGEAFYCIDEDGEVWSPAAQPVRRGDAGYSIRHGQGYSQFDVSCRGFETSLLVLVAPQDPVKLCRLRITNRTNERRRLTVASYVEWTLGASRAGANHNIQTRIDEVTGAQLAGNPALIDFGARVAFCDLGGRQQYCTDSRHEFLGRNGAPEKPAGLATPQHWSTGHGPGQDPCCAFALGIDLAPGASDDVLLLLGQAADAQGARDLILRHRDLGADAVLEQVSQRWNQLLGAVNIRTPDAALDLLFNRWLLYQTISCRLWARAAFYQAGGAYGFRDQLQDGLALLLVAPTEVRQHLLRAAARQYPQGDVQHWWHPPSGRGVRTHISDDRIWLPYAVSRYVEVTKDLAVLDEAVPFIDGPALPQSQEDAHYVPAIAAFKGSLYEHCARALECSFGTGVHGLPLMGGGDWNDGMNRVGWQGRGESVWLAWFLIDALRRFIPLARARRDVERAQRWEEHAAQLASACERSAWDGRWYRRAFFDDGTPLGSSQNTECRIDSLAQSWAVLSGAADVDRARQAMEAVERNLVQEETGLVLLFAPPFDSAPVDPGYIKGYLPGLRENGGQYTHAAIWVLMAEAALGNRQRVGELLRMLNPIRRSDSREAARIYRVEPYVVAADVYSGPGIAQRGGWTWYTGAAGWLHQAVLEYVLGLRVLHDTLRIKPCVPDEWPSFEVNLRLAKLHYVVRMERTTTSSMQLSVDGAPVAGDTVPLLRDGREHHLVIHLPKAQ